MVPSSINSMSSVEPPVVENVSPAVTLDTLPVNPASVPGTSSYTVFSSTTSMSSNLSKIAPVPSVVIQPHVHSTSFVNNLIPHNSFLPGTYNGANFGVIPKGQGAESIIPASKNSSYLPPTQKVESLYPVPPSTIPTAQNPTSFGQAFSNIPPPLLPPHQPPPQHPQPHQLFPSHHQLPPQQNVPPMTLPPHMMNNQMPPTVPGGNNQNWHSVYSRPPSNNQSMGTGGGWLR